MYKLGAIKSYNIFDSPYFLIFSRIIDIKTSNDYNKK